MKYYNPKGDILSKISTFELYESSVSRLSGNTIILIKAFLRLKIITEDELKKAVHDRLCGIGFENIQTHLKSFSWNYVIYPDHTMSPVSIGYAIKYAGYLTPNLNLIKFDHGETAKYYIDMANGLLETVMSQILTAPKEAPKAVASFLNYVPCADGGPCTC